jgi:hypothetical protein
VIPQDQVRIIKVRYSCGAYVTNKVDGVSTSCTESAKTAVRRQAEKLFPGKPLALQMMSFDGGNSVWRASAL